MRVHHGFSWPAEYPLAWSWPSLHGWRTSWYPQTVQQGRLRWLPEEHLWPHSETSTLSWSPEQSHAQDAGMVVSWWATLCFSGIAWSHEGQQFQACNDVASWRLPSMGHFSLLPLWRAAYVVPFHQWTCGLSAWYEPFSMIWTIAFNVGPRVYKIRSQFTTYR